MPRPPDQPGVLPTQARAAQRVAKVERRTPVASSGASGIFWPAASQAYSVLDSTSWDNIPDGVGKYEALALDHANTTVLGAWGYTGDAFPSMLAVGYTTNQTSQGFYFGDGTFDPYFGKDASPYDGNAAILVTNDSSVHESYLALQGNGDIILKLGRYSNDSGFYTVSMPSIQIGPSQGSNKVQVAAGDGVPTVGGLVGDLFLRRNGGVGSTIYRCTVAGAHGAATWAAIL